IAALRESISRVAVPERVGRPIDSDFLGLRDCARGRVFTYENFSGFYEIRRQPFHQIWLNWNESARGCFRFALCDLDMPPREIHILPFEANKLGRAQSGKSSDRDVQICLFITGPQELGVVLWREDPDFSAPVLRFCYVFRFRRKRFWQITARLREIEERDD